MDISKIKIAGDALDYALQDPTPTQLAKSKGGFLEPPISKGRRLGHIESRKRLRDLGFDPLKELVNQYRGINLSLHNLQYHKDGSEREKFSVETFLRLTELKKIIASDLLRYGYGRVSEKDEADDPVSRLPPINILITK
jgi:hypothetical protein